MIEETLTDTFIPVDPMVEHISYEFYMADNLSYAMSLVRPGDTFTHNTIHEAFWVHARNLIVYFDKQSEHLDLLERIDDQILTLGPGRTSVASEKIQFSEMRPFWEGVLAPLKIEYLSSTPEGCPSS